MINVPAPAIVRAQRHRDHRRSIARNPTRPRIAREKLRDAFFVIALRDFNAFNLLPQLDRRLVIVDGKFSCLNRAAHIASRILARDFEPAQTLLFLRP